MPPIKKRALVVENACVFLPRKVFLPEGRSLTRLCWKKTGGRKGEEGVAGRKAKKIGKPVSFPIFTNKEHNN